MVIKKDVIIIMSNHQKLIKEWWLSKYDVIILIENSYFLMIKKMEKYLKMSKKKFTTYGKFFLNEYKVQKLFLQKWQNLNIGNGKFI